MRARTVVRGLIACGGVGASVYVTCAAISWSRFGSAESGKADRDELLDRFMPAYEVVERHHVSVDAPPEITLAAARSQDVMQSGPARIIFRTREIVLGTASDDRPRPRGLVDVTLSLGWGLLAEVPGREIVIGAVTKPWEANVVFRAVAPDEFAAFDEPGYVKIAWTLRADPAASGRSVYRTETRAIATDADARARFRRYWAFASPGISTIRWLSLRPLKREAERRARDGWAAEAERAGGQFAEDSASGGK